MDRSRDGTHGDVGRDMRNLPEQRGTQRRHFREADRSWSRGRRRWRRQSRARELQWLWARGGERRGGVNDVVSMARGMATEERARQCQRQTRRRSGVRCMESSQQWRLGHGWRWGEAKQRRRLAATFIARGVVHSTDVECGSEAISVSRMNTVTGALRHWQAGPG